MNNAMKKLTLQQKIALCSGANEWDTKEMVSPDGSVRIPSVKVADGPHGLRKTVGQGDNLGLAASEPATCFPVEALLACSFDTELAYDMGHGIAEEAAAAGVCTILGPGANMKRNPLCGRNFEYLSEDPFLAGRMAAAYIKGAQSDGIGTSLKHFAANSQEYYRMTSDSRMDERTLREIYLSAFEYAVKEARPATVMAAYNLLNGINCTDNKYLLDTILRKDWGYQGLVVSDWGAINDRIKAFEAGCDLIMPGGNGYGESDVLEAVNAGQLDAKSIDCCAERVADFARKQRDALTNWWKQKAETSFYVDKLHETNNELACHIAEDSAVLLKNDEKLLPVTTQETLCVIGAMAEHFRIQGSGSSKINAVQIESFPKLYEKTFGKEWSACYAPGYTITGETTDCLMQEAIQLSQKHDTVLLFAGLPEQYEAEGMDRTDMSLPDGQNQLIEAVAAAHKRVIVVLISGCAVELPWNDLVSSVLWMGLPGQAGAKALLNLLTGQVNPSGKLAESWPIQYADCPSADTYLKEGRHANYREGIYIGYRHYEKKAIPVRYAFGHGLSYTEFAYSELTVDKTENHFTVRVKVTNTGTRSGSEAVLFYIHAPQDGIDRPARELKGFQKVHLEAGESSTVSFTTDDRSFAVWDNGWRTYAGEYIFEIGGCKRTVAVNGETYVPVREETYTPEREISEKLCSNEDDYIVNKFTTEYESSGSQERYTINSTVAEVKESVLLLKIVYWFFERSQAKVHGRGSADYLAAMCAATECPLRAVQNMVGMKHHFAQAIADFGNGHLIKGIMHLFR